MIFICTSMYCEAECFIKKFNLKKDLQCNKFQIFKNNELVIIITGIGKVKAAIAITYLFSKYTPTSSDLFINVGVCGSKDKSIPIGSVFLCNKIIENDTKRTFYPDLLLSHPFKEVSVETCSLIKDYSDVGTEGKLVDMEASGIYEAALIFMQNHQIFFIKVLSDYMKVDNITKNEIFELINKNSLKIIQWIREIKSGFLYCKDVLTDDEENLLNKVAENLKFTVTMKNEFKQLLIYIKLQGKDLNNFIYDYTKVKCKSKNEGKRYFERIKEKLI